MGYLYLTEQTDRLLFSCKEGAYADRKRNLTTGSSDRKTGRNEEKMRYEEFTIEGRNAVIEAFRSGKPIDKVFILDGCQDGPMVTIRREAKKKRMS